MPVAPPAEGYIRMIAYAKHKTSLRLDQLFLQALMAGFWVAIYGHCCGIMAGFLFVHGVAERQAIAKAAYGSLFPGAFVAVVFTGSELFTGNTVTMFMMWFDDNLRKRSLFQLLRVWGMSYVGNCIGAVFTGYLVSYLTNSFAHGATNDWLKYTCNAKVTQGFGPVLLQGFGCNALVCLATWCVVCCDDAAGKILCMWFTIGVFAMGGYEHIVANFYTLSVGLMVGTDVTVKQVILQNWIPVTLGNLIAGTIVTGLQWWYALHPSQTELAHFTEKELVRELTRRWSGQETSFLEISPSRVAAAGSRPAPGANLFASPSTASQIPPPLAAATAASPTASKD